MSEERHDVVLTVNGTAHPVSVSARRLLSDAVSYTHLTLPTNREV